VQYQRNKSGSVISGSCLLDRNSYQKILLLNCHKNDTSSRNLQSRGVLTMLIKNGNLKGCYLATTCNSMIIEMCDDMFRISYGFTGCQTYRFIAAIVLYARKIENEDILNFYDP
jgi:hypothetical protein